MLSTKKNLIWVYSLGRKTTVYEVAEAFKGQKGTDINLGPWYAEKNRLSDEGVIVELSREGRNKPFTSNIPKYLKFILKDNKDYNYISTETKIFSKFVSRVVDFIIANFDETTFDISLPFVYYLILRYLVTIEKFIPCPKKESFVGKVYFLATSLSEDEKRELSIPKEKEDYLIKILLQNMPSVLFKEFFVELGSKLLKASIFRKKQFDYLIDLIDYIETDEDIEWFTEKLEERFFEKSNENR